MAPVRLDDLPDVLKPAEAAKVLRVGVNRIYEMARTGELRTVRMGRRVLIPKSQLLKLLEE